MQTRFLKLTDSSFPEVTFGTFHSIFYQILRNSTADGMRLQPATAMFRLRLLSDISRGLGLSFPDESLSRLLSEISRIKNAGLAPSECSILLSNEERAHFPVLFELYNRQLKELGHIDFDDMVSMCGELLSRRPEVLFAYREHFKFILIDEIQDINRMQFEVVRLLAEPCRNLFVVGDDDQSIYGFRGSAPGLMLSLESYYPELERIVLDVNFRCATSVIQTANRLICENRARFSKTIKPRLDAPAGVVRTWSYETRSSQNKAIAQDISKLLEEGADPKEIAVIVRTNREAEVIAGALSAAGLPGAYQGRDTDFFSKPAVRDVCAYMGLAHSGMRSDYYRIMNRPLRYLCRESAPSETVTEEAVLNYYRGNALMSGRVRKLFHELDMLRGMRPGLAVRYVRGVIGLDDYYRMENIRDPDRLEELRSQLDELQELCDTLPDYEAFKRHMEEVRQAAADAQNSPYAASSRSGVRLITMHAAKGLEFDHVFIPDLNEGLIPTRRSVSPLTAVDNARTGHNTADPVEEERRLLYVAMTRARQSLTLSYIRGYRGNERMPSRFIRYLLDRFVER